MSIGDLYGKLNTVAGEFDETVAPKLHGAKDAIEDVILDLRAQMTSLSESCSELAGLNDADVQELSDRHAEVSSVEEAIGTIIATLTAAMNELDENAGMLGDAATGIRDWRFGS